MKTLHGLVKKNRENSITSSSFSQIRRSVLLSTGTKGKGRSEALSLTRLRRLDEHNQWNTVRYSTQEALSDDWCPFILWPAFPLPDHHVGHILDALSAIILVMCFPCHVLQVLHVCAHQHVPQLQEVRVLWVFHCKSQVKSKFVERLSKNTLFQSFFIENYDVNGYNILSSLCLIAVVPKRGYMRWQRGLR